MPLDNPLTISARPTIRIDGQELPLLTQNISKLRMRECLGGLSTLELSLVDILSFADGRVGYGATAESPLKLGAAIKLYMGSTEEPQEVFDGFITAMESEVGPTTPPLFTLLAEDKLFKARKARRSRTFDNSTPADVARAIAGDHGLTPEVRDGLDAPTSTWAQINESDLAFLRRVLERVDGDVQVVGDKLQVGPCARDARTTVTLRLGDNLIRARMTADLADQVTEIRVGSFDPATGEAVSASASQGELGPGSGKDGASVLKEKFSIRREHVGHQGPMTDNEGDKLAHALFGKRARRFVRVDAASLGDGRIRVGSHITLAGVNPFFENTYVVTEATHRFDLASGYLTEFLAEGAYMGEGR
jgi:phage protein D